MFAYISLLVAAHPRWINFLLWLHFSFWFNTLLAPSVGEAVIIGFAVLLIDLQSNASADRFSVPKDVDQ